MTQKKRLIEEKVTDKKCRRQTNIKNDLVDKRIRVMDVPNDERKIDHTIRERERERERARVESERERENAHSQVHRSKEL